MLVEEPDKLSVVEPVHEAAHQRPEIRGGGGDGTAVSGHIGQEQTADTAGGATGSVVNIAAVAGIAVGLAIDPGIQSPKLHAARGQLATTPNFHALHLL